MKIVQLDTDASVDFYASLPTEARMRVYECMRTARDEPAWAERLKSSYSAWHRIYSSLSSSFNTDEYLEDCLEHLPADWRCGLPLVEDSLRREEYAQAEELIEGTFSSLLRLRQPEKWAPEETLLVRAVPYPPQDQKERVAQLLRDWTRAVQGTGNRQKAAMLPVQLLTYEHPFQWDNVTREFKTLTQDAFSGTAKGLLSQWEDFVVQRSVVGHSGSDDDLHDTWIHWLIETGIEDGKDRRWFSGKVKSWLAALGETPPTGKTQQELVCTLTQDTALTTPIKTEYPGLCRVVTRDSQFNAENVSSRRRWLERMETGRISTLLIRFWKSNITTIMPDPGEACGSRYEEHAKWLVALRELDAKAYDRTMRRWMVDHRRRRNLWKAAREAGLPPIAETASRA